MGSYELAVKFSHNDTQSTQLNGVYLALSDDLKRYPQLRIPNNQPKTGCYYYGHAEISLEEVWITVYNFGDGQYGGVSLKSLKSLDTTTPKLKCEYE